MDESGRSRCRAERSPAWWAERSPAAAAGKGGPGRRPFTAAEKHALLDAYAGGELTMEEFCARHE